MSDKKSITCPFCNSTEVSKGRPSKRAFAISFLLLGFPLPFTSKEYHCFDCGKDFKNKKTTYNNGYK